MLKRFRKTGQEEVLEEEVKFEAIPVTHALSPEEQRLAEAQAALEAVKQQEDTDEAVEREAKEAQRRLEEAQRQLDKIKSDKDARFHEANKLVLEAQADIELAKQQKAVWEEVSSVLKNFQASPTGQGIPDETALVLGMMMLVIGISANEWNRGVEAHHIAVATRDWMRRMSEIAPKIATYHAYRKRIGLE